MDLQPLTSERLPTLPKLDKKQFIDSYLHGQRAHAKFHAEEGRSLASLWDLHSTPNKSTAVSSGARHIGFGTPILKARIPRTAIEEKSKKEIAPSKSEAARADKTEPNPKPKHDPDKTATTQNCLTRKRGADLDSDEDQAGRLLERRERKRVKRAIVQPKEASEHDTTSSHDNGKSKKRTKPKGKKIKVPSGFALMHGFTATNVGTNRLTLKPPSNVGVFKKGKASFKTKIKQKLKGHQRKHFSELGFLNANKKALEHAASESSSASGNESSVEEIIEPKKKTTAQKSRQAKSSRILSSNQVSELSEASAPQQRRVAAESEIWDIESRASEKRRSRMQKTCSMDEADTSYIQGTVVIDARIPAWGNRPGTATRTHSVIEVTQIAVDVPGAAAIPSSPSLRPSQSASQIGQLVIKPSHAKEASRYFPAQQQQQPTNRPITPTSPLARDPEPVENCRDTQPPNQVLDSGDLGCLPLPTPRFVVPTRNRIFAQHFLSVQGVRPESQDPYFYPSDAVVPGAAFEDSQHLEYYACATVTFPESPETEPEELPLYSDDDEPLHPAYGKPQLDNHVGHSSLGWDTNTMNPILDETWIDVYDYEELDESLVQYENPLGHPGPGYMEPVGDGDCIGYLEDDWQVGAGSDSGVLYDHCETGAFMDILNEGEDPDHAPNPAFGAWEDAAANSVYLDDFFEDGRELTDANNFMDEAPNGQRSVGSSPKVTPVTDDSEDIISDCSDAISAYHPHFAQGRALLLGLPIHEPTDRVLCAAPHFSHAELDVVKVLRDHWLPQRL
ncbi:hypothetical protein DFH09DRAFT_26190 [Mycena vulgaris]|nr:hypothetical protein DFH09DRAFT_26190 [Mycena vulgaris]